MTIRIKDQRVLRTKRLIRNALTELMEEKGFESFTVQDLTDKANINRSTFYSHYRDKYDLLEQSEDELLKGLERSTNIVEQSKPKLRTVFIQPNEPNPYLVTCFEYIRLHADFMKVNLGPKGNPLFQSKLKEVLRKKILESIMQRFKDKELLVPPEYMSAYITSAHLGVIQHWLETGMKASPREMSIILSKTTFWGPGYVAELVNPRTIG